MTIDSGRPSAVSFHVELSRFLGAFRTPEDGKVEPRDRGPNGPAHHHEPSSGVDHLPANCGVRTPAVSRVIDSPGGAPGPAVPAQDLDAELAATIVALAPDAILVLDESGTVQYANHQAEDMFGYDPGGLAGVVVEDLVPERLGAAHREHRARFGDSPGPGPWVRGSISGVAGATVTRCRWK